MELALTGRSLVWQLADIVMLTGLDVKKAKNRRLDSCL